MYKSKTKHFINETVLSAVKKIQYSRKEVDKNLKNIFQFDSDSPVTLKQGWGYQTQYE